MQETDQDQLKRNVKMWLKSNSFDYAWLAERCFVTETTVRNWMAKKKIPDSKAHIIEELIKSKPIKLPPRVQVEEETTVTLKLDSATRAALEHRAFMRGMSLTEFLAEEVPRLAQGESTYRGK